MFDAILPSDRKRYSPTALHERIRGRADVMNGVLDWAIELCSPYADLFDVIGVGNHETAVEKHHSFDPVSALIGYLNKDHGGNVKYGGYCGFYRKTWVNQKRIYRTLTIYRHHGAGGSSPVTKGMTDFQRMLGFLPDADVFHIGHKHNRFVDSGVRLRCLASGAVKTEPYLSVMSGAYMDTYQDQSPLEALKFGRAASYAADMNLPPQRKGGVFLRVELNSNNHSDPMRVTAEV